MSYKFEVESGNTVKFPVGGKYCDRDIEVTATVGENIANLLMNNLTEIDDDTTTSIRQYGLAHATNLNKVRFSKLSGIAPSCFRWCSGLVTVDLPNFVGNLGISCFASCSKLSTLIIGRGTTSVASISSTSSFTGTPIASGTGYIYVPAALVDSYKAATNWSTYAEQIRAIEDYPEITGGA